MNIYTLYSASHETLYRNFFLPSVPDNLQIVAKTVDQACPSGSFYQDGWSDICRQKVIWFRDICKKEMGDTFIYSDVDVQFFGDILFPLLSELGDYDIACQEDLGQYCSGFFICKASERTLALFECMVDRYNKEDQYTLNKYIWMVDAKYLSGQYYTVGHSIGTVWDGQPFDIPGDILVHHANWTVGVENKMKLLQIVRDVI